MIIVGTQQTADSNRTFFERENGHQYWRSDYFESPDGAVCSPQAYLIEQPATIANPTHYHIQNQFQLFTSGEGVIGRSPIKPLLIHYAGAYTGYGPITSGTETLNYMTFRAMRDPGAKFLPETAHEFKKGPKRHITYSLSLMLPEQRQNLSSTELDWIHPPEEEGLAIGMVRLPSSATCRITHTSGSIGCFMVVIQGSIRFGDRQISALEHVFISSDTTEIEYCCGTESAELLMLHFPPTDMVYQN
jgi:hypothetical protein